MMRLCDCAATDKQLAQPLLWPRVKPQLEACTICCTVHGVANVLATLRGCRGMYRSAVGAAQKIIVMALGARV